MDRKVEVVPATFSHVSQMAPRVRECDRAEVWAQAHLTPNAMLDMAVVTYPTETFACLLDGVVVAMFGVVEEPSLDATRAGVLWMLGTDDIYDNVDLFHKHTAEWLERYRERFDYIANWVDARNTTAVKWISSVGFTVNDPVPYGPDALPFHYFEWRAS